MPPHHGSSAVLLLWDIDHTLVSIVQVSQDIYAAAFASVTGQPLRALPDMTGRTEEAILKATLELNGVDLTVAYEHFYQALGEAAYKLEPRMREVGHSLPGAREAIDTFAHDGMVQSVVTGNIKAIAIIKLEAFDLAQHIDFAIGGYGDDGSDRAILVRLAIERAERKYGQKFKPEQVVVIGDTVHDIKGALGNGAMAVGVATGSSTVEALQEAGAQVVLENLADIAVMRQAVLGQFGSHWAEAGRSRRTAV